MGDLCYIIKICVGRYSSPRNSAIIYCFKYMKQQLSRESIAVMTARGILLFSVGRPNCSSAVTRYTCSVIYEPYHYMCHAGCEAYHDTGLYNINVGTCITEVLGSYMCSLLVSLCSCDLYYLAHQNLLVTSHIRHHAISDSQPNNEFKFLKIVVYAKTFHHQRY